MDIAGRDVLKQWFVRGAKPLSAQFSVWFDSFWHKNDNIPANKVEGLQETLNQKAEKEVLDNTYELFQELRTDFNSQTNSMNTAAAAAYAAQAAANEATQATQAATRAALEATDAAREEVVIMEVLRRQLVVSAALVPAIMELTYPAVVSIRNSGTPRIVVRLLPVYMPQNALFLMAGGDAVSVLPDGRIALNHTGSATVHVIPTAATHLYKTIQITVRSPRLRRLAGGGLRVTNTGHLRVI